MFLFHLSCYLCLGGWEPNIFIIFICADHIGTSLGFVNAEDPCCGGNFPPFICFKGTNSNTSSVLCDDRSKFVFWDAFHPTEAANIIMARKLLNGDESISYPINIIKLYNYKP